MAGSMSQWSYTTTLDPTPASARRARAFVLQHLIHHRLRHLVDPVQLVASELATNALVHAQTAFCMTLSADDQAVLLTVRDDSPSLPRLQTAQDLDPTGRGLSIVDVVSTEWGVRGEADQSKSVWASFSKRQ
jgi:anti-sigma regulatory factor (Ser/Thr protein kinase)